MSMMSLRLKQVHLCINCMILVLMTQLSLTSTECFLTEISSRSDCHSGEDRTGQRNIRCTFGTRTFQLRWLAVHFKHTWW